MARPTPDAPAGDAAGAPHVTSWDDALLDRYRGIGDPAADAVMAEVIDRYGLEEVNRNLRTFVRDRQRPPGDLPAPVRRFLADTAALPTWMDEPRLVAGQRLFAAHGSGMVMMLFCASLPMCYAAAKGAQVLHMTQRMTGRLHYRVFQTAQFLIDVMAPNGLGKRGRGLRAIQKVRLTHAAIRHYIGHELQDDGTRDRTWGVPPEAKRAAAAGLAWDDAWGVPINQEDLAGTLMSFAVTPLDGLKKLGHEFAEEEEEDFLHCWQVVGHVLGVNARLLPRDMAAARALTAQILSRNQAPSEAGRELTKALIAFMEQHCPGRITRQLPVATMRHCLDPAVADMLGIPPSDPLQDRLAALEARIMQRRHQLVGSSAVAARMTGRLSLLLLQGVTLLEGGGRRPALEIPEQLNDSWGLSAQDAEAIRPL